VRPTREVIAGMTLGQVFDYLAVRLDGPAAVEFGTVHVRWVLDAGDGSVEAATTELSNGTLHSRVGALAATAPAPDATVRCTLEDLHRLVSTAGNLRAEIEAGRFAIDGDADSVCAIFECLTPFEMFFAVVEP
jgi:alkyl sulfatase BDS1-like metallo-beta-lactamase superfamily hydrolase